MILENRGTNKTIQYFCIFFRKLYDSLESNENTITYSLEGDDFSMENFTIYFIKNNEDYGLFEPNAKNDVKNKTIYNCNFYIHFTDIKYIVELSAHELNHCYEYIKLHKKIQNFDFDQIDEIRKPLSYKIKLSLEKLLDEIILNDTYSDKFLAIVKNTFNSEYNARISQLHAYLLQFKPDKKILTQEIYNSKTYQMYKQIEIYINNNILYKNLLNEFGEDALLKLTNLFNEKLISNNINLIKGYEFIKIINKDELEIYYNRWINLFKHKNKKHYQKMFNVVDEVIDQKNIDFRKELEHITTYSSGDFKHIKLLKEYHESKNNIIFNFEEFNKFKEQSFIKEKLKLRIEKLNRILKN